MPTGRIVRIHEHHQVVRCRAARLPIREIDRVAPVAVQTQSINATADNLLEDMRDIRHRSDRATTRATRDQATRERPDRSARRSPRRARADAGIRRACAMACTSPSQCVGGDVRMRPIGTPPATSGQDLRSRRKPRIEHVGIDDLAAPLECLEILSDGAKELPAMLALHRRRNRENRVANRRLATSFRISSLNERPTFAPARCPCSSVRRRTCPRMDGPSRRHKARLLIKAQHFTTTDGDRPTVRPVHQSNAGPRA